MLRFASVGAGGFPCSSVVCVRCCGPWWCRRLPSVTSAKPPTDDGGQPLPGYTVVNPPLAPMLVNGAPTTVYQGIFEHAAFDIEVPPKWNGDVAMYAHG